MALWSGLRRCDILRRGGAAHRPARFECPEGRWQTRRPSRRGPLGQAQRSTRVTQRLPPRATWRTGANTIGSISCSFAPRLSRQREFLLQQRGPRHQFLAAPQSADRLPDKPSSRLALVPVDDVIGNLPFIVPANRTQLAALVQYEPAALYRQIETSLVFVRRTFLAKRNPPSINSMSILADPWTALGGVGDLDDLAGGLLGV